MTEGEFRALVERAERELVADPDGYRQRLQRLVTVGNAAIAAVLALALLPAAAAVGLLWLAPGAMVPAVGGALAVLSLAGLFVAFRVARLLPEGFERFAGEPIGPADGPELLGLLDRMRAALGGPGFAEVRIMDGLCNVGVAHVRLPGAGRVEHHLHIGLDLMHAVAPATMEALVAGQQAWLARVFAGPDGRIHRARRLWQRIERAARGTGLPAIALKPLVALFLPGFEARWLPLARAGEHEADRCVAGVTSSRAAADALVAAMLHQDRSRRFWAAWERRAAYMPQDLRRPARELAEFLRRPLGEDARAALDRMLAEPAGPFDAHPGLRERLEALGEAPRPPPPPEGASAAQHFLGPALGRLMDRCDREWTDDGHDEWLAETREDDRDLWGELQELQASAAAGPLAPEERNALDNVRARLAADDGEALALCRAVIARDPANVDARFLAGRLLLEARDDEGIALIDAAMKDAPELVPDGCDLVEQYLLATDRLEASEKHEDRWARRRETAEKAGAERRPPGRRDELLPHGLPPRALETFLRALGPRPEIRRAWLVRKKVRVWPKRPCLVLCAEGAFFGTTAGEEDYRKAFAAAARAAGLPRVELVLCRVSRRRGRWLVPKLEQVPGSLVIDATAREPGASA